MLDIRGLEDNRSRSQRGPLPVDQGLDRSLLMMRISSLMWRWGGWGMAPLLFRVVTWISGSSSVAVGARQTLRTAPTAVAFASSDSQAKAIDPMSGAGAGAGAGTGAAAGIGAGPAALWRSWSLQPFRSETAVHAARRPWRKLMRRMASRPTHRRGQGIGKGSSRASPGADTRLPHPPDGGWRSPTAW